MKKKSFITIMIAATTAIALASCGKKQETEETSTNNETITTIDNVTTVDTTTSTIISTTEDVPTTDDGGDTPGTDDGGDTPGTDDGGDTPGTDDGGDTPGTDDGGDTPGTDDGGDTPGTDDGGDTPGTDDGGDTPGTDDGGDTPGTDDGGDTPGTDDGGDTPGTDDGGDTPGTDDGGDTPGTDDGGDTPTDPVEPLDTDVKGNILSNGTFSGANNKTESDGNTYIGAWGIYSMEGGASTADLVDGELKVSISNYGTVNYSIQVAQKAVPLGAGSKYTISFEAYATTAQKASVVLQMDGGSYTSYLNKDFNITTEKQVFTYEFTASSTDEAAAFCFNLGKVSGLSTTTNDIYFNHVSIVCTYDSGAIKKPLSIFLNQVGYYTNGQKTAVFSGDFEGATYYIKDALTDEIVYTDTIDEVKTYEGHTEKMAVIDFSSFKKIGTYYIESKEYGKSLTFEINDNPYEELYDATIRMLYLQRCGCTVEDSIFGHSACHTSLATVYGTSEKIDVNGGWHDAGDYGKYVVAGAKTIEDLFIAYENTGYAALLDEAKYELDWMLKMQNSKGEVYHKVSTYNFPGNELLPQNDYGALVVSPVSYAATADFSAVMARAAKLYATISPESAALYKAASIKAYNALSTMEAVTYTNPTDITTGEYPDSDLNDELCYAAMALYDLTGDAAYIKTFEATYDENQDVAYGWMCMTAYAYRLYLKDTTAKDYAKILALFQGKTKTIIANMNLCPYTDPINGLHEWGSNLTVCSAGMILMDLDRITGVSYSDSIQDLIDYLLGKNASEYCYVTGFGEKSPVNPHHRPSMGNHQAMPGMLVGGPNSDYENNGGDSIATSALSGKVISEKSYIDNNGSWSTNEITIYWNSPLIALLSYFYKK